MFKIFSAIATGIGTLFDPNAVARMRNHTSYAPSVTVPLVEPETQSMVGMMMMMEGQRTHGSGSANGQQQQQQRGIIQEDTLPKPILAVSFGTTQSPVPKHMVRDYGGTYTADEDHSSGLSWGWNCNLHARGSTRVRDTSALPTDTNHDIVSDGGSKSYLRSIVIPDRRFSCHHEPLWRVSLPKAHYTIRISATDLANAKDPFLGHGCRVHGVKLGALPAENSCATTFDPACFILPNVYVGEGDLEISGSYHDGCRSLNYIGLF